MANNINTDLVKMVGNPNAQIIVPFAGWSPSGGVSDAVRDGAYAIKILTCSLVAKKEGVGVNANIIFGVVGPECSEKGKTIVVYHPIPIGDSESADNRKKRFLNGLIYSIMSGLRGQQHADALKNGGNQTVSPAWFENKVAYAKVRSTVYQDRESCEITGYITKDQFEVTPGPFGKQDDGVVKADAQQSAAAIADAPAVDAAPTGSDPVSDMLG